MNDPIYLIIESSFFFFNLISLLFILLLSPFCPSDIKATNLTTTSSISGTMGHAYSTLKEVEFSNDENIRLVFPSGFTVRKSPS